MENEGGGQGCHPPFTVGAERRDGARAPRRLAPDPEIMSKLTIWASHP